MTRRYAIVSIALLVAAIVAVPFLFDVAPLPAPARQNAVGAGGVTLVSTTVALPDDTAGFPSGPGAALLDANCTGCHSASMVLGQPPLKPEQWQATVKKMREVYKAPIAERDVPALLRHLSAIRSTSPGS